MYLFDTDILSNLIKKEPSQLLLRRLTSIPAEEQFTSVITVGEMIYGAYRSNRPDYFFQKLDELVWPNVIILPFDEKAARRYGRLRSDLEKAGTSLSEPDLRIASIALAQNLALVTANTQHFSRIQELGVENWLI